MGFVVSDMEDYELLEFLNKGSYGQIYKARRLEDDMIVVIKRVALGNDADDESLNEVLCVVDVRWLSSSRWRS